MVLKYTAPSTARRLKLQSTAAGITCLNCLDTYTEVLVQVMRKKDLIRKNLVENACFEKEIMSSANNPFIVRSFYSFTSKENLYIVMEWISGGDTASLLKSMGALDEDVARQYIAETILALEWCHSQGIIHR